MIEDGAEWPEQLMTARAAFLPKEEDGLLDPAAYRALLMLSSIYHLWARVRLKHIEPWSQTWAMQEMLSGMPGQGANGYQQALRPGTKAADLRATEERRHARKDIRDLRKVLGEVGSTKHRSWKHRGHTNGRLEFRRETLSQ